MEKHDVHEFEEPDENLKHKIEDEDDAEKLLCGYGACTPSWLQGFHNAKCLLVVLGICAFIQVKFQNFHTHMKNVQLSNVEIDTSEKKISEELSIFQGQSFVSERFIDSIDFYL